MRVPLGVGLDLRHGHDVVLCDHCRRYLHLREEAPVSGRHAPVLQES